MHWRQLSKIIMILAFGFALLLFKECRTQINDVTTAEGGDVTFVLPSYSQCGKYKLIGPWRENVVYIESSSRAELNAGFSHRAEVKVMPDASFLFTLRSVSQRDKGSYATEPQDGRTTPDCLRYYSVSLIETGERAFWEGWGAWSACQPDCGVGTRRRGRNCTVPGRCGGEMRAVENCRNQRHCPDPVTWSAWSTWSGCSVSCDTGVTSRERSCWEGLLHHSDEDCEGAARDIRACQLPACPEEVTWSAWSPWSGCLGSCDEGERSRERDCQSGDVRRPDGDCEGSARGRERCRLAPCPETTGPIRITQRTTESSNTVSNSLSEWGTWSTCSQSCGKGVRERSRDCIHDNTVSDCHEEEACLGNVCADETEESRSSEPSVPLSAVVGGASAVFILLLLLVIAMLLCRLRRRRMTVPDNAREVPLEELSRRRQRKKTMSCDDTSGGYAEIKDVIYAEPGDVSAHDYVKFDSEGRTIFTGNQKSSSAYDTPKTGSQESGPYANLSDARSGTSPARNVQSDLPSTSQSKPSIYMNALYGSKPDKDFYVTPKSVRKVTPVYDSPRRQ